MSLETWIQEFYPKKALRVLPHESLNHSITKWTGLLPENLEKHGVRFLRGSLYDGRVLFEITSITCSLCFHFAYEGCKRCPLHIVRDNVQCDRLADGEQISPYDSFIRKGDPQPMLDWLHKAKKIHDETYPSNPNMPVS